MAKFSQGFLSGISDFGKMDPSQPQRRLAQAAPQYKQMGTTDPLARRVGSLFGNLGIDTSYMQTGQERADAAVEGIDMSKPMGIAKAMLARAQYIQDPAAQQAMVLKAQEIIQAEQQKQADQAAALQQTQQKEVFIRTLIAQANEANRPDIAQMLAGAGINIDDKILQATIKDLREIKTNQIEKVNSLAGRKIRYTQAGLPLEQWDDATIRGMSPDSFKELIAGKTERSKAKTQFFKTKEGNTTPYRVNDFSGQVENPQYGIDPEAKQWVNASELGLQPAPKVAINKNFNSNNAVNEKLLNMGVESFEQLNTLAIESRKGLRNNERALENLSEAYTGLGANAKLGIDEIGKFFASAIGAEYDETNIVASQSYLINRISEMAVFIQQLGSGTGLSDKDAQLALTAVAGDLGLDEKTIRGVINEFIAAQNFVINQRDKAAETLKKGNLSNADLVDLIGLMAEKRPQDVVNSEDPNERARAFLGVN